MEKTKNLSVGEAVKVIEEKLEKVLSGNTVKSLCVKSCDEFDRGKINGKIEVLNELISEFTKNAKAR